MITRTGRDAIRVGGAAPVCGTSFSFLRTLHSIGRRDVIELCEGIVDTSKPIQANRVQALVSKMFSFAVDVDLLPANPFANGPAKRRGAV